MRQLEKLKKNTEVLDVSEFLQKKVPKETKNKIGESIHRNKSRTR